MSSRWLALSFASMVALGASGAGCSGVDTTQEPVTEPTPAGDDDDDGADPTPTPASVTPTPNPTATPGGMTYESEVNDTHDTANPLSGLTFTGACGDFSDFADIFVMPVAAGKTLSATLQYAESVIDDLDLWISSYDYAIDVGDEAIPPGDAPAQVTGVLVPASQNMYFEVTCYNLTPDVAYTGTITVQ